MARTIIAQYLSSRLFRRDDRQQRFAELRKRDGDACRRCRRPMRFDLPSGHDQAPTLQPIGPKGGSGGLDNLCLCHTRCNRAMVDSTPEVEERLRLREEAAALAKSNKRARKAA